MLGQRGLINLGEENLESVLVENARAVVILDDLHGCLALAEAGDSDVLYVLLIGLADGLVELGGVHGEAKLDLVGRELFESSSH